MHFKYEHTFKSTILIPHVPQNISIFMIIIKILY